jgi:hypothetical protein
MQQPADTNSNVDPQTTRIEIEMNQISLSKMNGEIH